MPQLNKGGKFVFGKSRVRDGGELFLPGQAMEEYDICREGRLFLPGPLLRELELSIGAELLCIRSSDIAFTLGARGPLLERARNYSGEIPVY